MLSYCSKDVMNKGTISCNIIVYLPALVYIYTTVKVIHVHLHLRKIFLTLIWNDQQSLHLHLFHIVILPKVPIMSIFYL